VSEPAIEPVFSAGEARALAAVLDSAVPPSDDGRLPGAGALGLAQAIEEVVRRSPDFGAAVRAGLAALEKLARRHEPGGFEALGASEREAALRDLASEQPGFLPGLLFQAYAAYYQHPRVLEGLGLEPRPPHPKGYEMEESDPALLDAVRRRPALYRKC
jgi:hypothetical protein